MITYSKYLQEFNDVVAQARATLNYMKDVYTDFKKDEQTFRLMYLNFDRLRKDIEEVEKRLEYQVKDEKEFEKEIYIPVGYKSMKEYLEANKETDPYIVFDEIKKVLSILHQNYFKKIRDHFCSELSQQIGLDFGQNTPWGYFFDFHRALLWSQAVAEKFRGDKETAERLAKAMNELNSLIKGFEEKIRNYHDYYGICGQPPELLAHNLSGYLDRDYHRALLTGQGVPLIGNEVDKEKLAPENGRTTIYYNKILHIFSNEIEKYMEYDKDDLDKYPPQVNMRDILAYLFDLREKSRQKWKIVYDYYQETGLAKQIEERWRKAEEERRLKKEKVLKEGSI